MEHFIQTQMRCHKRKNKTFLKHVQPWNLQLKCVEVKRFLWYFCSASDNCRGDAQFDVGILVRLNLYAPAKLHNLSCSWCAQLSQLKIHNCDTMKVHNCEKMKVHNCEQLKLHNLLGKSAQLWTTESTKLCKSNLANGTEDTSRLVRERRRPPIESCDGVFSQLSWNSQLSVLSDANKRKYIWSDLFRGLMVEVVKEAEMLADGTTANVRAALSGKAAITRPAKRAI